jgi:hypothetical protein
MPTVLRGVGTGKERSARCGLREPSSVAIEQQLFTSINSRWSDRFDVYPSLPFASVIDFSDEALAPSERTFLLNKPGLHPVHEAWSTNAWSTTPQHRVDGLSHGFSRLGEYVGLRPAPSNDPRRHEKLDLKVRAVTKAGYPLVVVSYEEKNPIGKGLHLTIVDGIIGQVLADREYRELSRRLRRGHNDRGYRRLRGGPGLQMGSDSTRSRRDALRAVVPRRVFKRKPFVSRSAGAS